MLYNKHKMHVSRGKLSVGLAVITAVLVAGAFISPLAHAASKCGDVDTAIISCDASANPVLEIVKIVLRVMIGLVGVAAVGALIFAGIIYSSAGGEQAKVQKAKTMIQDTVIGIVLFGTMFIIGNFFIPNGIFGGDVTSGSVVSGGGSGSSSSGGSNTSKAASFTIATYNIRVTELTSWDTTRANSILNYLKTVDVSGIQEGREDSIKWLTSRLKTEGYARTSNQWARQVFWNKDKFSKISDGVKELDKEKDLVWAKLKEKVSGKTIYVVSIHLNQDPASLRVPETKSALSFIKKNMSDSPTIFVGDFNSESGSEPDKLIKQAGFKDSYDVAKTKQNTSFKTTLTGFTGGTTGTIDTSSGHQIDHIYVKGNLTVNSIEVVRNKGSDHLPVEANIGIPGSATNSGTPRPTNSISLDKVKNFRDVATLTPTLVKPGLLFRSANLYDASSDDKKKLASVLKGGTIIDLRTPSVRSKEPDQAITGVTNVNYPVTGASSGPKYKQYFIEDPAGRASFKKALEKIADSNSPILIHCTHGKDRTGWTIALVMYILGANDKQVMAEYLKSKEAGSDFNVEKAWLNDAISLATNKGKRSMVDYIKSSTDNGLGVSDSTIAAIKSKLGVAK